MRFDFDWSRIQPDSSTSYDWSGYNRVAAALKRNGMKAIGIIDYTPAWARPKACTSSDKCPPAHPATFAQFAAKVAKRYASHGLRTWEIWNEENSTQFWKPAPNPKAYTRLLRRTYDGIKAAEPHSTVLVGGTSAAATGNGNLSAADFLRGVYVNGGKGHFDAVADHPYTRTYLPSAKWSLNPWRQMVRRVRKVMVKHGDANKQIWITEFGASTGGPGSTAANGLERGNLEDSHVTPALQAQMVEVAARLARAHNWIGAFVWYSYQDSGTSQSSTENFYGLITSNGTRKPALKAYHTAIVH